MKKRMFTLLIFILAGEFAFGQEVEVVATNIAGDTVVQTKLVRVKTRMERIEHFCRGFEIGVSGGIARPKVYSNEVWISTPTSSPFIDQYDYKTGGVFAASVGYHIWHMSLSASYTRISELSYKYGANVSKNLVYYFAKPMSLWGLAANFQTKFGLYGGVNSAYIHFDYGDRYMPRNLPYPVPNEPAPIARWVTIGLQVGYTYTFYKGFGANAEVGMSHIPLKDASVKLFYFPLTMGLRYRFEG